MNADSGCMYAHHPQSYPQKLWITTDLYIEQIFKISKLEISSTSVAKHPEFAHGIALIRVAISGHWDAGSACVTVPCAGITGPGP